MNTDIHIGGNLAVSLAQHEASCKGLIAIEQEKVLPDNRLIAVLCDSVRLALEFAETLRKLSPIAEAFGPKSDLAAFLAEKQKEQGR